MRVRKSSALALIGLALLLVPTYVLVKGLNVVGENVQPRYLLPLIVVFAGIALLSDSSRAKNFSNVQLWIVVAGLAIAESVALYTNMRRYITGALGHGFNLNSGIQWWWSMPVSPMVVWVGGSIAFSILLFVLVREMNKLNVIA
jgi:drug/metabolite transporter (DMT)-like permease